jgi:hypothetical protein
MTPTSTLGAPLTRASLDDFAREIVDPAQARERARRSACARRFPA